MSSLIKPLVGSLTAPLTSPLGADPFFDGGGGGGTVTYEYTGQFKTLFQSSSQVNGISWDGTNFTTATNSIRYYYNFDNSFNGSDIYDASGTDGQGAQLGTVNDMFIVLATSATVARYQNRNPGPLLSETSCAAVTTTPSGLFLSPISNKWFISSDAELNVYETNGVYNTIVDTWDVSNELNRCTGVCLVDDVDDANKELWVCGDDLDNNGVVIGYSYLNKNEIGRFSTNTTTVARDIDIVSGDIWVAFNGGRIERYSRV